MSSNTPESAAPKTAHDALDKLVRLRTAEHEAEDRWQSYLGPEGNKTDDRLYVRYVRAGIRVGAAAIELLRIVDCDGYV